MLAVPHIVICGHTDCGAMKGALQPEILKDLPHAKEWVSHTHKAALIVDEQAGDASEQEKLDLLTRENVLLQIAHLQTHPTVAARLAAKKIQLHGWVYDIKSGGVVAYDDDKGAFVPVADKYQEAAAKAMGSAHDH